MQVHDDSGCLSQMRQLRVRLAEHLHSSEASTTALQSKDNHTCNICGMRPHSAAKLWMYPLVCFRHPFSKWKMYHRSPAIQLAVHLFCQMWLSKQHTTCFACDKPSPLILL